MPKIGTATSTIYGLSYIVMVINVHILYLH